jgi:hypothetical protein
MSVLAGFLTTPDQRYAMSWSTVNNLQTRKRISLCGTEPLKSYTRPQPVPCGGEHTCDIMIPSLPPPPRTPATELEWSTEPCSSPQTYSPYCLWLIAQNQQPTEYRSVKKNDIGIAANHNKFYCNMFRRNWTSSDINTLKKKLSLFYLETQFVAQ